jgi:7-cyano-7-deazaguanine reductase
MEPKHLGQTSALPATRRGGARLRPNPRPGSRYLIRFAAPEFTSLCPITGQPDFAHLVIDYVPGETIVESKSLKLFLGSFRNHGAFHEDCTVGIGERLFAEMKPRMAADRRLLVSARRHPDRRVLAVGRAARGVWMPPQDVPGYRGRG